MKSVSSGKYSIQKQPTSVGFFGYAYYFYFKGDKP